MGLGRVVTTTGRTKRLALLSLREGEGHTLIGRLSEVRTQSGVVAVEATWRWAGTGDAPVNDPALQQSQYTYTASCQQEAPYRKRKEKCVKARVMILDSETTPTYLPPGTEMESSTHRFKKRRFRVCTSRINAQAITRSPSSSTAWKCCYISHDLMQFVTLPTPKVIQQSSRTGCYSFGITVA
jgi:hypothetical protein